jgi:hypothetical protein
VGVYGTVLHWVTAQLLTPVSFSISVMSRFLSLVPFSFPDVPFSFRFLSPVFFLHPAYRIGEPNSRLKFGGSEACLTIWRFSSAKHILSAIVPLCFGRQLSFGVKLMGIYAKCRRRLKYVDYVAIIEADGESYHSITLFKQGEQLFPIGMSPFPNLEAAKKDCASSFDIRESDWSDLPDGLICKPKEGAVNELYREFDEFQRRPWESDPVVPYATQVAPGTTRRHRRLLIGTWRYGRYTLRFDKDVWSLSFNGEMLIRPLNILKTFTGPYSCAGGIIGLMAGLTGSPLAIAHLDEDRLVLTDGSTFTGNFKRV